MIFLECFVFVPRSSSFSVGRRKRCATSSHVKMTTFVNVCDVKSAEKRYDCLNFVNNKTKNNQVISNWFSLQVRGQLYWLKLQVGDQLYWSEISCIGPSPKSEDQYS